MIQILPTKKHLARLDGANGGVRWDALKPDPLHALLNHSDCDGEIDSEKLPALATRLRELVPILRENSLDPEALDWAKRAEQFAEGCDLAAAAGQPLLFR